MKNAKTVYAIEVLFLIVILLVAVILLFSGPISVKKISAFNSDLLLKITKLNKDINLIESGLGEVIYYGGLKPSPSQKTHLKKALSSLGLYLIKTDEQYKKLDGFIKKNRGLLKNNRRIAAYFNKSYFQWKNINKPIIKIIIRYPDYVSPKISYKLFLENTLHLSHLPTANVIKDTKLYFKKLINTAIYLFMSAVFAVMLLSVLLFYYFNKFQEILLKNEQKFESMFNDQQSIGLVLDVESGRIINANNAAVKFYGYSQDELLNMDIDRINVFTPAEEHKKYRQSAKEKGSNYAVFKHRLKNGDTKVVESRASKFMTGDKAYLLNIINDITEKVENEKWMNILYEGVENSPDWMLITDRLGNIEYVNSGVENITGYKKEELLGKNPRIFKSGLLSAEFYKTFWNTISSGEVFRGIFIDRRKNGELFTLNQAIVPIKNKEDSKITNFVSIAKDITQEKALEGELKYISFYDPLTKLPNKSLFILTVNQYLGGREREYKEKGLNASLVIIDFHKLSYVNNTYGYDAGDKFLKSFSKRLGGAMRGGDIIARLEGGKFGILFVDLQNKEDILQIINRIKEEFKNPLHIGERQEPEPGAESRGIAGAKEAVTESLNVSFTMGVSVFPDDGKNAEDLLKSADIALSNAKEKKEEGDGDGEYEFFKASMNADASEFLMMKNSIISAFKNREFLIYYQPYFDIKTGKIKGMEALARWSRKDAGIIPPVKFIPFLEKTGLIRQFEEFLIDNICKNLREWKEKGFNVVPVSMNISPASFRKEGLIDMIVPVLDR